MKICANLVEYLKSIIFSDEFASRHKISSQHFTRTRCLPFSTLILFWINFLKGSLQDELDRFFQSFFRLDVPVRRVTKSALCRARLKIKPQAFVELNQHLVRFFYRYFPIRRWWGLRLLAIDGSTVRLPNTPSQAAHFGLSHSGRGPERPLARISQLFDLLNRVTLDARLAPLGCGERALADPHLSQVGPHDLVILDRGYAAGWLLARVRSQGADFCLRAAKEQWAFLEPFLQSGAREATVLLTLSEPAQSACRERGLPVTPFQVRLLRIEVDAAEPVLLMTSLLDAKPYRHATFKHLYQQRWQIEENYKIMKCRMEVENWSGKSVQAVYQDFYAKCFSLNLTAILAHPARDTAEQGTPRRRYTYQLNFAQVLSKMKGAIVWLVRVPDLPRLIQQLHQVFVKTIEPIRSHRTYPRKRRRHKRDFNPCYKTLA